jgi:acyl carrier protein phosphodiesterase
MKLAADFDLDKHERNELRHHLQVLVEHARTVRNAVEPETGRLRITGEVWADQWAALTRDIDFITERIIARRKGQAHAGN